LIAPSSKRPATKSHDALEPTLACITSLNAWLPDHVLIVPPQETNCGVADDLQVVEVDPGAAHGVSFTPGLELLLGR